MRINVVFLITATISYIPVLTWILSTLLSLHIGLHIFLYFKDVEHLTLLSSIPSVINCTKDNECCFISFLYICSVSVKMLLSLVTLYQKSCIPGPTSLSSITYSDSFSSRIVDKFQCWLLTWYKKTLPLASSRTPSLHGEFYISITIYNNVFITVQPYTKY